MQNKKVVYVTGCLGFIGAYITRACLKKGWYVRGVDKINPNKNVHFISVKTLYFFVKGLIITRYPANAEAFKRKREFPTGIFGAFIPVLAELKIKNSAPENPINIPESLINVIFSFKSIYDRISTITGAIVIITHLLIGVESSSPLKNASMRYYTKVCRKNN